MPPSITVPIQLLVIARTVLICLIWWHHIGKSRRLVCFDYKITLNMTLRVSLTLWMNPRFQLKFILLNFVNQSTELVAFYESKPVECSVL